MQNAENIVCISHYILGILHETNYVLYMRVLEYARAIR